MVPGFRIGVLFLALSLLTGCSSRADARPDPNTARVIAPGPAPNPQSPSPMGPNPPRAALAADIPERADTAPPSQPPADPKTGEVPRSLPELKLALVGMHIGGGPNDAETKRPFIETIEKGFDSMQACYVDAEEPAKGGTFGVDLRVDRSGGHPDVQAVRSAMKGDKFRACVQRAFEGLEFSRPTKPTVLSASVRFSLEP